MSVSVGGEGVVPQVNKFEQISSDGHQMSVAGGRAISDFQDGTLPCELPHDACDVPPPPQTEWQVPVKTTSHNFVWRR